MYIESYIIIYIERESKMTMYIYIYYVYIYNVYIYNVYIYICTYTVYVQNWD